MLSGITMQLDFSAGLKDVAALSIGIDFEN